MMVFIQCIYTESNVGKGVVDLSDKKKLKPTEGELCDTTRRMLQMPEQVLGAWKENPSNHLNLSHRNISMHILHTVIYMSPNLLTKRTSLTIRASLVRDNLLYSQDLNVWLRGDIVGRN